MDVYSCCPQVIRAPGVINHKEPDCRLSPPVTTKIFSITPIVVIWRNALVVLPTIGPGVKITGVVGPLRYTLHVDMYYISALIFWGAISKIYFSCFSAWRRRLRGSLSTVAYSRDTKYATGARYAKIFFCSQRPGQRHLKQPHVNTKSGGGTTACFYGKKTNYSKRETNIRTQKNTRTECTDLHPFAFKAPAIYMFYVFDNNNTWDTCFTGRNITLFFLPLVLRVPIAGIITLGCVGVSSANKTYYLITGNNTIWEVF